MSSILGSINPQSRTDQWLAGGKWQFRFTVHPIWTKPSAYNAVYAFVRSDGHILYIGRAETLAERLSTHHKMFDAVLRGASELWVHQPIWSDPVHFHEVERLLIQTYCPPLNEKLNPLAGLLSNLNTAGLNRPAMSLADLGRPMGLLDFGR